jgi:glutamyl-tRNA reductase
MIRLISPEQPWVVGVEADSATAADRARLARAVERQFGEQREWILLNTCHRLEVYGFGPMPDLENLSRLETGEEAVRHLIRVAAGLESTIVGEDEILHQVRDALKQARESRAVDRRLQRLFETAIAAGRQARAGRTVSSGSLAQRAVRWLEQRSTLAGRNVLVVGAGRMGSGLAHSARLAGAKVTIASRHALKAQRLAEIYGGQGVDLASGAELARQSAAIAIALAGPWSELRPTPGDLPPIADISAPAAISAVVRARLDRGFLGIDDLYSRADPVPGGYADHAEGVVATKTREYVRWLPPVTNPILETT